MLEQLAMPSSKIDEMIASQSVKKMNQMLTLRLGQGAGHVKWALVRPIVCSAY